jgi:CBS domain containing-hemolysin-like protein
MANTGFTKMPVVNRDRPTTVVGMVALSDLMKARLAAQDTEERRERVLRLRVPLLFRGREDKDSEEGS